MMSNTDNAPRQENSTTVSRMYKLVVYFNDGNTGRFYSNDRKGKQKKLDKEIGLIRLRKLVKRYKNSYSIALIYNVEKDELIEKYDGYGQSMALKKEEPVKAEAIHES